MGVTGLWTVLQPCARPIKIETLNKKRLAVDASIWIYQFLKAVRDKEGNALRNSHVVGFFRRICKLLFIGIKPVFVFDGGAPALKRQTISHRKSRREGRREDAVRTAGKLLAVQMQRRAEEEEQKRKEQDKVHPEQEEQLPEELTYVGEAGMTQTERQQSRKFKKKDAYHLPALDVSLAEMGGPNDPRIMSLEELEHYARQFDTGEDINVYDFSKIDFDSPFFVSLPASDRYNILNAARLRSRLRMGYSKDQLDSMFPDRMAFSKFQIERVRERNELTQRLMNINGMINDGTYGAGGRVAGEKGREYVLVKNDGVEGGWALGVVSNEGERSKPIDVERVDPTVEEDDDAEWEEDDDFEDVPIEGLNRLPKQQRAVPESDQLTAELAKRRRAFYQSRTKNTQKTSRPRLEPAHADLESLFVEEADEEHAERKWEDVHIEPHGDPPDDDGADHDVEVQKAIQMSLQNGGGQPIETDDNDGTRRAVEMSLRRDDYEAAEDDDNDDLSEVFQQRRVEDPAPFSKSSGKAIAHTANNRSGKVSTQPFADSDSDEDGMDLHAALAESRQTKYQPRLSPRPEPSKATAQAKPVSEPSASAASIGGGFSGPLPFEKLDLGSSLLGKKKMQKLSEDASGGFEKEPAQARRKVETPPPWFSSNLQDDMSKQREVEAEDRKRQREAGHDQFITHEQPRLRGRDAREVIDVDAMESKSKEVIDVLSSADEDEDMEGVNLEELQQTDSVVIEDPELRAGDLADKLRAEPPEPLSQAGELPLRSPEAKQLSNEPVLQHPEARLPGDKAASEESEDEAIDWEESEPEDAPRCTNNIGAAQPAGGDIVPPKSPSETFEIVGGDNISIGYSDNKSRQYNEREEGPVPASGLPDQGQLVFGGGQDEDEDVYSDPEDEELFRQLAVEAEEHARFASSLNNRSQEQNAMDYEKELRQLRNQQKKDRRDADEVTQTMITECQQLLSLFGLPYITAPMEAEAQCAELVSLGLVDGIVTDDSDIFLFGGTRVYKNMFNQAKYVECYLSQDLEAEFTLTRENLIAIAQLLGSDYTEGLPGVGPVSALEIISEFGSLKAFKEWFEAVQHGSRSKADDAGNSFRRKFRRNATKLFLPTTFPDPRVEQAYLKPDIDNDPSTFVWGVPDLDALRSFLMATIGWSQERTDEVLVPVIKDMNQRSKEGTQANITSFFDGGIGAGAFAPRRREVGGSKRLEGALGRMAERAKKSVPEGEAEKRHRDGEQVGNRRPKSQARRARRATKPQSPPTATSSGDEANREPRKKKAKKRAT